MTGEITKVDVHLGDPSQYISIKPPLEDAEKEHLMELGLFEEDAVKKLDLAEPITLIDVPIPKDSGVNYTRKVLKTAVNISSALRDLRGSSQLDPLSVSKLSVYFPESKF